MAKYTARVYKEAHNASDFIFSIDYPRVETFELTDTEFIAFRAWAFSKISAPINFVFSFDESTTIPPNTKRADVQSFYKQAPLLCGLHTIIPFHLNFKFGIVNNGLITWLATVEFTALPVLEGLQGYLFLNNDDNRSVEQYSGSHSIDKINLSAWDEYFTTVHDRLEPSSTKFAFCIAPAKEYIFPDYYPVQRLGITPHDQFFAHFSEKSVIINPLELLYPERHLTYSKNDTHWTDFGASLVTQEICSRLGIEFTPPSFPYTLRRTTGDLGIKFNPQKVEHCFFADNTASSSELYDNNIPVRGNILSHTNPSAILDETCLIFGSSSSASIALQLTSTFKRVVRVFSGADIDYDIIAHEKPSCVIVVFASRFLVKAPSQNFNIGTEITRKLKSSSNENLSHLKKLSAQTQKNPKDDHYSKQLLELIELTS